MKIQLKTTVLWKLPQHNLYTRHFLDAIEGSFLVSAFLGIGIKKIRKTKKMLICMFAFRNGSGVCVYYSGAPLRLVDDEHVGTETFANLLINDRLSFTTTKVSVGLDSIIANRVAR
jgi:hypothetical protein